MFGRARSIITQRSKMLLEKEEEEQRWKKVRAHNNGEKKRETAKWKTQAKAAARGGRGWWRAGNLTMKITIAVVPCEAQRCCFTT